MGFTRKQAFRVIGSGFDAIKRNTRWGISGEWGGEEGCKGRITVGEVIWKSLLLTTDDDSSLVATFQPFSSLNTPNSCILREVSIAALIVLALYNAIVSITR